ncbi:MAG: GNAT family N-acetyltransferase [Clostridiales bacterium]|nr:GNAT family N-acetyltransferase [Clostridiales bacterium]
MVLNDINEPIGSIAVVHQQEDVGRVHIGYCIGRQWWRQGYTSEALRALVKFFFEEVGVTGKPPRFLAPGNRIKR